MIQSSIGRKIIMAITGIFLIFFLLLHLSINFFLFYGEKTFNNAVIFMRSNIFIKISEYILALGFIIHILLGFKLHLKNKKSKGKIDYYIKNDITTFSSKSMIYTGFLILCFLILHLMNFMIPIYNKPIISDYILVISLFKNPIYTLIYLISFCILGIHLNHGFQSTFQSLGFSNKRNFFWIQKLGYFYTWFICCGFSIIAIWFFLKN